MGARDGVSKLYVGNLPNDTTEQAFSDHLENVGGINLNHIVSIVLKPQGFGFIECTDQITADMIIDKFDRAPFGGAVLNVEPAVEGKNWRAGDLPTRVVFSTTDPQGLQQKDVEDIIEKWGGKTDAITCRADLRGTHGGTSAYIATLVRGQSPDELVSKFNGTATESGARVRVKVVGRPPRNGVRPSLSNSYQPRVLNRLTSKNEFPLRIMVPSKMVGAIIGKNGSIIREITQSSGARVDIHKTQTRQLSGIQKPETVVVICGPLENSSKACRKILEILVEDANENIPNSETDICLHLLGSNSLIGRVIGKGGCNIKKIMQDTQTKIQVSNQATEFQSSFLEAGFQDVDRIITIRGSVDGMCKAESLISSKLKASHEVDLQAAAAEEAPVFYRGMEARNHISGNRYSIPVNLLPQNRLPIQNFYCNANVPSVLKMQETASFIFVPQRTIGFLIGTKGSTIRELNKISGATIKIENAPDGIHPDELGPERRVSIWGPADSHPRAQLFIYDRLRQSGLLHSTNELKFTVEMMIPTKFVGRLIGKAGVRIQELQQQTSTVIKFVPFNTVSDISIGSNTSGGGNGDGGNMLARIQGGVVQVLTAEKKLRNNLFAIMLYADSRYQYVGVKEISNDYYNGPRQGVIDH